MGIQGLLPFLKKIHQPVNISDFKGCTVAVDAYCWLHKGAFSCAEKLAMGEKTEQYVYYCMKYVDYLLRKGLKPILVFDGCHLKSKEDVEKTRRGRRELNRKKAAQLLREGKKSEARDCLQKCVDITPQMALNLMNVCRDRGVDCIVAPYEADAQLAYLNLNGIAQLVVTEDSDLLLFGCDKVIFKMDFYGNGILIEKSHLNEVLAIQNSFYSFEKFRYMCILSGCDYLPSLPGIGLVKACKVLKTARQQELRLLLKKLPTYLKMNLIVSEEYIEKFICADNTFLYQLVFDPLRHKMVPLNPYPPEVDPSQLDYAGQYMPDEKAYQIALGNVDIHTHKCLAFFDPATFKPKTTERPQYRHQLSIWDPEYRIKTSGSPCKPIQANAGENGKWKAVHSKTRTVHVDLLQCVPIKPEPLKDPGKLTVAAERLLMSQYEAQDEMPEDRAMAESSQKENLADVCMPSSDISLENHLVEENGEERMAVKSPKKGRKRKAPSWLEETAIKESGEESSSELTHGRVGEPSPSHSRNVFAVSPAKKSGRFNLEAHALKVKSRYFGNSLAQCHMKVPETSLDATHSKSPADKNSSKSQPDTTSCLTSPKNRLLSMFENAPVKAKTEKDEMTNSSKKETSKSGLHKYFHAKSSLLTKSPSNPNNTCGQLRFVDIKVGPASGSLPSLPSKDSKFLSQGKTGMKSKLSAFSWSKSGPISRHLVKLSTSGNVSVSPSAEESPATQDSEMSVDCDESPSGKDTEESTDSGVGESLDCLGDLPDEGGEKKHLVKMDASEFIKRQEGNLSSDCSDRQNSSFVKGPQDENSERIMSKDKDVSQRSESCRRKPCKVSETGLSTDSASGDEVTELQSCSYSEYILSLGGSATSDKESPSSASGPHEELVEEGMKVTTGEDCPSVLSQRSSLGSIDSFCLDSSQVVVDLTDTDIDLESQSSQSSQTSTGSRSSSFSASSKGCRISGLSRLARTKVKPGVKRSSNKQLVGQPSITDMISKYW